MAKLFGFSIEEPKKDNKNAISPVPQNNEDGADYFLSSGFYGQYVDIEGVFRTEFDVIKRYRDMALHPECDTAIEHVVNEAIVSDSNDSPVEINLDNLNVSDKLKKIVRDEFKGVKDLLQFDKKAHEIFRNWYTDGRIFYHKVIDMKKPDEGIQELRYIDSLKLKFMRVRPGKERGAKVQRVYLYYLILVNKQSLKMPRSKSSTPTTLKVWHRDMDQLQVKVSRLRKMR